MATDLKIFNHPRPKKSVLGPAVKKRKTEHKIEEIEFDFSAREDYLTGFHKRKVQRHKQAQLENEKKAKEEKVVMRKQLREERTHELKQHVAAVNALLQDIETGAFVEDGEDGEWGGISDDENEKEEVEVVDHEQEYIDEDKYTTVTVEAVDVSKEGLLKVVEPTQDGEEGEKKFGKPFNKDEKGKKVWPKKVKKKKFTYESKIERKLARGKQSAKNRASADARRGND